MKKYVQGYALGVLFGLLFFVPVVIPISHTEWSTARHVIALVIFASAIVYLTMTLGNYTDSVSRRTTMFKGLAFFAGLALSLYGSYSIWGVA